MKPLTASLEEIENRLNARTPGKWSLYRDPAKAGQCLITAEVENHGLNFVSGPAFVKRETQVIAKVNYQFEDAQFIVACPTDISKLLKAVKIAEEALNEYALANETKRLHPADIAREALVLMARVLSGDEPEERA